ncbi:MAG: hypothetical protein ABIF77_01875 [bacterium]
MIHIAARGLLGTLVLIVISSLAAPEQVFGRDYARPKDDRQVKGGLYTFTAPFTCFARDTLILTTDLDTLLTGDTSGNPDNIPGYACQQWAESGGEDMFRLEVLEPVRLDASLQDYTADLDIFLLSDCDSDSCLAGENSRFGLVLDPGVYWLSVDGFQGDSGVYGLHLECSFPGVSPLICHPDTAKAVQLPGGGGTYDDSDSIFGHANLMPFDERCSPFHEDAGEVWYALTLPPRYQLTITVSTIYFDVALWLFDGCGAAAECLDFADDGVLGEDEIIEYTDLSGDEITLYLGVDGFRAPNSDLEGSFELSVNGVLPAERKSMGALKQLYR